MSAEPISPAPYQPHRFQRIGPWTAGPLRHGLSQAVGHGFGDERLAAAGWPIEEDAFGGDQPIAGEQLTVHVGELNRVADLLDLVDQAAHLLVGDVGNLFQDQLLDLGPSQALDNQAGLGVEPYEIARPDLHVDQRVGHSHYPLVIGVGHHNDPSVVDSLPHPHDLTDRVERSHVDDSKAESS